MTSSRPRLHLPWRVLVLAVAIVIAFAGGATAKGRYDAANARRVDGLSAVKSSASASARKGKLVATDPKTGQLPGSVIGTVPKAAHATTAGSADQLGGHSLAEVTTSSLSPFSYYGSGVTVSEEGPGLSSTGTTSLTYSFILPPTYAPGAPVKLSVLMDVPDAGACSLDVQTAGLEGPDSTTGDDIHNGGWNLPGSADESGPLTVVAGSPEVASFTFTWAIPSVLRPGGFLEFTLQRNGAATDDTCGTTHVLGLQLTS